MWVAATLCDAIDPSPQAAALLEVPEALPKLEMDFLKQVSLFVEIHFVGAGDAAERAAELRSDLAMQGVLAIQIQTAQPPQ